MEEFDKTKNYYLKNKDKIKQKYEEKKRAKEENETYVKPKIGRPTVNKEITLTTYTQLLRLKRKLECLSIDCPKIESLIVEFKTELEKRGVKH